MILEKEKLFLISYFENISLLIDNEKFHEMQRNVILFDICNHGIFHFFYTIPYFSVIFLSYFLKETSIVTFVFQTYM